MFCMNCGQQLPDDAKFCINCGTPQGAVSSTKITKAETNNPDGMHISLKKPKIGDEICFGTNNGQRIQWKVLLVREHTAFIISSKIITEMPYHQPVGDGDVTWANCTLRKWLNNDFIVRCFTPSESSRILPCKLNNDNNPLYNTTGGAPTIDKVFLLSINEANTLFPDDQARANGSDWWLRSPGEHLDRRGKIIAYRAAGVYNYGTVYNVGFNVTIDCCGVRPAMWIKLDN